MKTSAFCETYRLVSPAPSHTLYRNCRQSTAVSMCSRGIYGHTLQSKKEPMAADSTSRITNGAVPVVHTAATTATTPAMTTCPTPGILRARKSRWRTVDSRAPRRDW